MSADLKTAQLRACESVIERGQQTFVEVGQALARIRDERLFREDGYTSFDDYCQARWAMRKTYASMLIGASEVAQEFTNVNNEGQARALRRVPQPQRVEVMEQVVERAEQEQRPVSAALIEEVAGKKEAKPKCQHCEIHCPSGRYGGGR